MGCLVRIPFGHRRVRGIVRDLHDDATEGLQDVAGVVVEPPLAPGAIGELLDWIAERYTTPRGRTFERIVPPRVRVRPGAAVAPGGGPEPLRISDYEGGRRLLDAISSGAGGGWLVRSLPDEPPGVLVAELVGAAMRSASGGALVLVPEVRYGSIVIRALQETFDGVARLDSAQPDGDRSRAWIEVASGARLAVGGRGAVLAPMEDLRVIIVDEAHARTYKEDRAPRIDARVVALQRGRLQGALCVYLSPSPTMELSGWAAAGRIETAVPRRAAMKAARPVVQLVEPPPAGLSRELHRAVRDTLRDGRRVGILAPLPGYARALWCASCRRSVRCARCEAGMILESGGEMLRCPRCDDRMPAFKTCPSCGAGDLRVLGAGSERLTEQVRKTFPRARVHRMDPSVLATDERLLAPDDADIYLTTWVGVKNVLRPDVSTVGVLDADTWIRRVDFRAAENAFHALAEMSGWAGPASMGGRLVIQTSEPGHHAIQAVVRGDPAFFFEREAALRKELHYPPFSELIKVRAEGPERDALLSDVVSAAREHDAMVLGPIRIPARHAAAEAGELLLKCRDAQSVCRDLRGILPEVPRGSRLVVNVDPR